MRAAVSLSRRPRRSTAPTSSRRPRRESAHSQGPGRAGDAFVKGAVVWTEFPCSCCLVESGPTRRMANTMASEVLRLALSLDRDEAALFVVSAAPVVSLLVSLFNYCFCYRRRKRNKPAGLLPEVADSPATSSEPPEPWREYMEREFKRLNARLERTEAKLDAVLRATSATASTGKPAGSPAANNRVPTLARGKSLPAPDTDGCSSAPDLPPSQLTSTAPAALLTNGKHGHSAGAKGAHGGATAASPARQGLSRAASADCATSVGRASTARGPRPNALPAAGGKGSPPRGAQQSLTARGKSSDAERSTSSNSVTA